MRPDLSDYFNRLSKNTLPTAVDNVFIIPKLFFYENNSHSRIATYQAYQSQYKNN